MRSWRWAACAAVAVLLAGCGSGTLGPAQDRSGLAIGGAQSAQSAPTGARVPSAAPKSAKRLENAWVRLRQETYIVHPGDRVRMFVDFLSSDKPVDWAEARWQAWDGRFDRWFTRSPWLDNSWTAPDAPGGYRMDVDLEIRYRDGTSERTNLNEIVWVR